MSSTTKKDFDGVEYNAMTGIATRNQLYTEEKRESMSPVSESGQSMSSDHEPLEIEERKEPLSKLQVFLLNLTWFGLYVMFLDLSVVVVPAQIQTMVGSSVKGRWLGGMVAGGAVVMFITGPLTGVLSDRLVSRHGRRRPIMFAGSIVLIIGLAGMALSCVSVTAVQSPLLPMNGTTDECIVDLEERRCAPYQNNSGGVPMIHQGKPGDMAGLSPQSSEASGPVSVGNIGMFIIFYMILAASFTAVTVSYNALIADKSHPLQRGVNSGVMGAMILCGNICGASIGMFFMQIGVIGNYALIAVILFICVLATVYSIRESPAKEVHEPLHILSMCGSFWEPLKENDFRWVFITRFFMQQGLSTVLGFLEYWLSDMVHLPHCWSPSRAVAMMLIPLLGTAAIGSVVGGLISDRTGRRKPLVIVSSMMMFLVCSILAFIRGHQAYYIALTMTFIFGAGFGSYQAVDFALVMDVLPVEKDKAKDLAVWHQALILPQALATPIGGVLLDLFEAVNCHIGLGYIILYLVTAVYFFLSGSFVLKIKGVS